MNFSRNVVSARIRTVNPGIGAWTHKREGKREKRERTPLLHLSPHRKKTKQKKQRIFSCAPWNCNDQCETIPYSIIYEHKLKGLKAYPLNTDHNSSVYAIQILWLFANSCRLVMSWSSTKNTCLGAKYTMLCFSLYISHLSVLQSMDLFDWMSIMLRSRVSVLLVSGKYISFYLGAFNLKTKQNNSFSRH